MTVVRVALFLVSLSIIMALGTRADAQKMDSPASLDGNDWVSWPDHTRLIVLYGFVNGMNMTIYSMDSDSMAMSEFDQNESDSMFRDKINRYIVKNVTISQLYKGVNEIYADNEERGIALSDVVYFVVKWINGCGEEEFNKVLKYIKHKGHPGAMNELIVRRDDGLILKKYEFP